jgi:hypothetical protein
VGTADLGWSGVPLRKRGLMEPKTDDKTERKYIAWVEGHGTVGDGKLLTRDEAAGRIATWVARWEGRIPSYIGRIFILSPAEHYVPPTAGHWEKL